MEVGESGRGWSQVAGREPRNVALHEQVRAWEVLTRQCSTY